MPVAPYYPGMHRPQLLAVARAAFEAGRAVAIAEGRQLTGWENLPEWKRGGYEDAARLVLAGASAQALHENWVRHRAALGWILGPSEDNSAKTHPLMKPWAELTTRERMRDVVFQEVARIVARSFGWGASA